MDALARGEQPFAPGDRHPLRAARFEMHFDPAGGGVVESNVRKRRRIEIAAQQRVDVIEDVAVECRRDAERIVVGGGEPRAILGRVDADQQPAAAETQVAYLGEQAKRIVGGEVADARARIEERRRAVVEIGAEVERAREVGDDAGELDLRIGERRAATAPARSPRPRCRRR